MKLTTLRRFAGAATLLAMVASRAVMAECLLKSSDPDKADNTRTKGQPCCQANTSPGYWQWTFSCGDGSYDIYIHNPTAEEDGISKWEVKVNGTKIASGSLVHPNGKDCDKTGSTGVDDILVKEGVSLNNGDVIQLVCRADMSCGHGAYLRQDGLLLTESGGSSGPQCGNGTCESGETAESCPTDCDTTPGSMAVQKGTRFYWEVEWIDPVPDPWTFSDATKGYNGTGYFDYGDNGRGKGEMKFAFEVTEAGKYICTLRGRRDREGPCEDVANDRCNDVFTKMDDGMEYCKTMIKGGWGAWIWQSRIAECGDYDGRPVKFDLSVGRHTYYVQGRSKGVKLDAVAIYLDGTEQPMGPITSVVHGPSPLLSGVARAMRPAGPVTVYTVQGRRIGTAADVARAEELLRGVDNAATYILRYGNGTLSVRAPR